MNEFNWMNWVNLLYEYRSRILEHSEILYSNNATVICTVEYCSWSTGRYLDQAVWEYSYPTSVCIRYTYTIYIIQYTGHCTNFISNTVFTKLYRQAQTKVFIKNLYISYLLTEKRGLFPILVQKFTVDFVFFPPSGYRPCP